jgi:hypothetical protein
MIRRLRTPDNGWYITEHRVKHNHTLTENCGEKVFWPSHKHINVYTRDLIRQLRDNNINIRKVYSIIAASEAILVRIWLPQYGHAMIG